MSFSTSPCNIIQNANNSNSQLYRKFIFSVIVFELVIAIVLVFYSTVKNYPYKYGKKQPKQQKQEQRQTIKPKGNQIKSQVIPTTLSIYGTSKSGNSLKSRRIMNIRQNSLDSDICESVVLEKKTNRTIKGMEMKRQPQRENICVQNPSFATMEVRQSQITPNISDNQQTVDKQNSQSFQFINIGNLRLSQDKASMHFNILLGHFFVSGSLAMQICPELTTSIISGGHFILFLVILVVNIFFPENLQIAQYVKSKKDDKNDKAQSIEFKAHLQTENNVEMQIKKEQQKKQSSMKQKINTIASVLIIVINICLLTLVVVRMKQSYFNIAQTRCL